jgi:hypothetical protein
MAPYYNDWKCADGLDSYFDLTPIHMRKLAVQEEAPAPTSTLPWWLLLHAPGPFFQVEPVEPKAPTAPAPTAVEKKLPAKLNYKLSKNDE